MPEKIHQPPKNYQNEMPGVYIEETDSVADPVVSIGASTVAFIGQVTNSNQHPNKPKLISSWNEFVKIYHENRNNPNKLFQQRTYLPYAVHSFFKEGGSRCYIVNELLEEKLLSVQKKESVKNNTITLTVSQPKIEKVQDISFTLKVKATSSDGRDLPTELFTIKFKELDTQQYTSPIGTDGNDSNLISLKRQENSRPEWDKSTSIEKTMFSIDSEATIKSGPKGKTGSEVLFIKKESESSLKLILEKFNILPETEEKQIFTLTVQPDENLSLEEETLQILFNELSTTEYSDNGIKGDSSAENGSSRYIRIKKPKNLSFSVIEKEASKEKPLTATIKLTVRSFFLKKVRIELS